MYDIIVAGAGCAGMTASLYALRAGKSVLLLESTAIGGQIAYSPKVENFPSVRQISGMEFSSNLFDQITDLGVKTELDTVQEIKSQQGYKTIVTEYGEFDGKAVIIACGLQHRSLGLPREEELTGNGVSYCALCDGAFYKGKTAAVVGGGSTALEDAIYLSTLCEKVFLIHRRDTFRGEQSLVAQLKSHANVELLLNTTVSALLGETSLQGLTIKNLASVSESTLTVDGLFIAVGYLPNTAPFRSAVQLDETGFVVAGEDCRTSADGIFTAGDCRTKEVRQLTTAASDGTMAALAACRYVDRL